MLVSIFAAALLATAPTSELKVDVGHADWRALPALKQVNRALPTPEMVQKVEQMLVSGDCHIRGQSPARFDITVPYAVQVNPDGTASHVVVGEMGCPALESYAGLIVLELARQGDFHASAAGEPKWYASSLNFNEQ
ncbi:MAG TPA: hypothetical protein VGF77_11760 [Allosphingosinicella sp.]